MVDTIKGAEYTIHKRGADGKRGIIIDKYIALQIEQRWTEPSKFVITGKGLTRVPLTIGDGVDIYRDGALFLTGVVDTAEETCDEMQHGTIDWTVTGRDITSLLERRLVLPDPIGLNFSEAVQDVMTDTVGNAIRRYVERNAGESAAAGRRLGSLTVDVAEPEEGNTYAYRLMTLDKVCAEIGAGEAMPMIEWNPETGDMELNVITRREKADTVIFSPVNGTITRWTKKKKLPKANALWAISGGDEQIVTYTQHAQSIAAYGRFEGYIKDSAQMQEATEEEPAVTAEDVAAILENKSAERLNKEAATESYSVDVCESPSLRFMEHWKCGDRVTCIIDGEEIVSTIESVSIFTSQTGERLSAKIGEVERGIFAELFEQISELQEKVEIERAIPSGGGGTVVSETTSYINGDIVPLTAGMVVQVKAGVNVTVIRSDEGAKAIGVVADESIPIGEAGKVYTRNGIEADVQADSSEIEAGDGLTSSATKGKAKTGKGFSVGVALENKADGIVGNVKSLLGFLFESAVGAGNWWIPDGIVDSNVIAAYQFKGAESESDALTNKNATGTFSLTKTNSNVTWNQTNGFTISANLGAGLDNTNITSFTSVMVKYSDMSTTTNQQACLIYAGQGYGLWAAGYYRTSGTNNFTNSPGFSFIDSSLGSAVANGFVRGGSQASSGVLCWTRSTNFASNILYMNGSSLGLTGNSAYTGPTSVRVLIGNGTSNSKSSALKSYIVQAVAFYNTSLTAPQVVELTNNMNAL